MVMGRVHLLSSGHWTLLLCCEDEGLSEQKNFPFFVVEASKPPLAKTSMVFSATTSVYVCVDVRECVAPYLPKED